MRDNFYLVGNFLDNVGLLKKILDKRGTASSVDRILTGSAVACIAPCAKPLGRWSVSSAKATVECQAELGDAVPMRQ